MKQTQWNNNQHATSRKHIYWKHAMIKCNDKCKEQQRSDKCNETCNEQMQWQTNENMKWSKFVRLYIIEIEYREILNLYTSVWPLIFVCRVLSYVHFAKIWYTCDNLIIERNSHRQIGWGWSQVKWTDVKKKTRIGGAIIVGAINPGLRSAISHVWS